jgi:PAS domain S-box-containing protein
VEFEPNAHWLGSVLATLPGFVLVVDRDGVIRYINRVEPGYVASEVVGMKSKDFLFPESMARFQIALDTVFEGLEAEPVEAEMALPDGSLAWYRSDVVPLEKDGEVVAALIIATNITELRASTEMLARVKSLLPICAWCDRIRDGDGTWGSIESYLRKTTDTDITHGLCPDCESRMTSGVVDDDRANGGAA